LRGSLPSLDLALQRSLGFPPVHLAASLWASLAPTLRWLLEVRRAEHAYKPDSVPTGWVMTISLGRTSPCTSMRHSSLGRAVRLRSRAAIGVDRAVLLQVGFARACVTAALRELLPHDFTLAARLTPRGMFLWYFPSSCPDRTLSCTLPFEARTFLTPCRVGRGHPAPRWCWDHSSRPVARFRPSPTCQSCGPCGWQLAIFARAPGLPPTG